MRAGKSNGVIALSALVLIFVAQTSCGGSRSSAGCAHEAWQGQCALSSVKRVRIVERFPRAFVVLEALYEPRGGTGSAPPTVRHEVTAQAEHEAELRNHLEQNPVVQCSTEEPRGAACEAPEVHLALPEFRPGGTAETAGPEGCAQIESATGAAQTQVKEQIREEFRFEQDSAVPTPEITAAADRVAQMMKSDPAIQCVGIAGNIAYGEPMSLADQRAEAVRDLIAQRGVERGRLVVFRSTTPTYAGTAPQERAAMPEHRSVVVSVVLYDEEAK